MHTAPVHYYLFNGCFPGEPGSSGSPHVLLHMFWKRTSLAISGTGFGFLWAWCPSCHPTVTDTDKRPFNGIFSRTTWVSQHQKVKPFWILMKQEMMGWQWHQLDHMQIICTLLQTD